MRVRMAFAAVLSLTLLATACSRAETGGGDGDVYKIGYNSSQTGGLAYSDVAAYGQPINLTDMHSTTAAGGGLGQGHDNMQPSLALNYVIALQGIFPSRN